MPNSYVIIGVLSILLAGAGGFGYYQTKQLGAVEVKLDAANLKIKEKEATITQLQISNSENVTKIEQYQANVQALRSEKNQISAKAIKDLQRVEKVAKRKSKLYEKLVNRDFQNMQNELKELTQ